MDQSQDATRIHLGNIYNGKKKTHKRFKRYYLTVVNANAHITLWSGFTKYIKDSKTDF